MSMDDIRVDTPLGKTVAEIEENLQIPGRSGGADDRGSTILALCAALREAHLDSRIEQSATDQHIKTTHKFQQQLREAKERIAELEALVDPEVNAKLTQAWKDEHLVQARREAFERTREAVNAACSCGGKALGEGCCSACEVWHRVNQPTGGE